MLGTPNLVEGLGLPPLVSGANPLLNCAFIDDTRAAADALDSDDSFDAADAFDTDATDACEAAEIEDIIDLLSLPLIFEWIMGPATKARVSQMSLQRTHSAYLPQLLHRQLLALP